MKTMMQTPPWPRQIPRIFSDRVRLERSPIADVPIHRRADWLAEHAAYRRRFHDAEATGLTNTYNEAFFVNEGDFTALASSSSEGSLITNSTSKQPFIPANWFMQQAGQYRGIRIEAQGVFGTTSTPTLTFQVRLGETAGTTFLSGTSLGVSAAITTGSGVSNKWWRLQLDLICTVRGIGTGNATLAGAGYVMSPGGFASPFIYPLEPTTPDTATWTATFNAGVTQYINLSATWSASSASNTITCKQLVCTAFG